MADLCISSARDEDLADLLSLYRHLVADDMPITTDQARAIFKQFQSMGDSTILVGRTSGQLVCSCVLVIVPNLTRGGAPYGLIENVVTHSNWRNKGIGQDLIANALKHAWAKNCYKVMLLTGSKKPETHAFYEKCGFEQSKTGFQVRKIAARSESQSG